MSDVYSILQMVLTAASGWFTQILQKTGAGPLYLAGVFIVLAIGFLMSSYRNGIHAGSDVSVRKSDKAAGRITPTPGFVYRRALPSGRKKR